MQTEAAEALGPWEERPRRYEATLLQHRGHWHKVPPVPVECVEEEGEKEKEEGTGFDLRQVGRPCTGPPESVDPFGLQAPNVRSKPS